MPMHGWYAGTPPYCLAVFTDHPVAVVQQRLLDKQYGSPVRLLHLGRISIIINTQHFVVVNLQSTAG